MSRRTAELVRGVVALAATVGLVVGPPALLVAFVGWPLPTELPGLGELGASLQRGIDDRVVVKALAVIAWLAWAQVAAAILVEALALLRSRPARHLPVLPGVQLGAARLLATAALLVSSFTTPRAAAHALPARLPDLHQVAAVQEEDVSTREQRSPLPAGHAQEEVATATYTVRRGDTYWDIAEKLLGDGLRWQELRGLNVDRTMPDGTTISATSEVIRPGWMLIIPADAIPESASGDGIGEVVVERGGNLWEVASEALANAWGRAPTEVEIQAYWQQLVEGNRTSLADPGDPNLVFAGQVLTLPPVPALPTTAPPSSPNPDPPTIEAEPGPAGPTARKGSPPTTARSRPLRAGDVPVTSSSPSTLPNRIRGHGDQQPPSGESLATEAALLGVASTALAAGVVHELRRRRQRRLHLLQPGAIPAAPPPELDELRTELALAADEDHTARLDASLRGLATALAAAGAGARPRLVQTDGAEVEVLLSEPAGPAPTGWRTESGDAIWCLDRRPPSPSCDLSAPAPLIISLGRPEDGRQLYLDLEAQPLVSVTGDPAAVAGLVRSMLVELSTSLLADSAAITVVGKTGDLSIGELDRLRVVPSWSDVADDLMHWSRQASATLEANGWPNAFVARGRSDHDGLAPHLAVCFDALDTKSLKALRELGSDAGGATTVVLVGQEVPGAFRIELQGDQVILPDLGMACRCQALDAPVAEQVRELLADADVTPGQLSFIPDEVPIEMVECEPEENGRYHDPEHHVLVRLLGDITVDGGSKALTAKQAAVVAYVALHAPVAAERVEDAIWTTPTTTRRKRLANTISACRAILGASHLPVATDGRYSVGPKLRSDVDLFDRRLAFAAQASPEVAAEVLRGALELVRGPLFAYRSAERASYVWVDLENWVTTWEVKVIDASLRLVQLSLDIGDVDGAIWAAQRGLLVAPVHSALTESLMAAYHERGDRLAAERVYRSHLTALEQLEIDDVADTTVELYEQIRRRAATG